MAKVGYLMRFAHYDDAETDIEWMKGYGCCEVIEEQPEQEKLRPLWNKVLENLHKGDELIVPKLSNVLQGTRQLAFFLEFCRIKVIRIISIHDKIDSGNELFPETKTSDVLFTIALLPEEVNANRKATNHIRKLKSKIKVLTSTAHSKAERTKFIVNMYKSGHTIDDIWKTSGFKSRSSVFRVLNEAGVVLNRGHTKGSFGPRKNSEESQGE
ncbi:recombinase family protein [Bacteroides sp. 224]|uniref:recombinase family protein n=1 Tax=Bacteroides sp. 224 TaxID=2302936 RepID=UPI0013D4C2F7|nr:recombinase family protein [Bacteroides sp. 224]NDV66514.1 recombinase family protein [Bacteroides sp. 224]